ncbi:Lysosomal alpha-mannosidase-like protein, partial [Leptotrombidium deliense]
MCLNFITTALSLLPLLFVCVFSRTLTEKQVKCDYERCPTGKPNHINVHLVSHSHDDVGWLKTVDQYYYGARTKLQPAGVQYILDTVVSALIANPDRRFVYVETAFFWKWWQEQNNATKQSVVDLVEQGRFEFISGGWSMNDEAATHYNAIIDQMTLGHKILADNFGKCGIPKVAWQIDPFGHSREQAFLFTKMNFDGLFLGRVDWMDKTKRSKDKTMEIVWETTNEKFGGNLFTGILPNVYFAPKGFCFDDLCTDDPIIDDASSDEYNVDKKVFQFINETLDQSMNYFTNHLIMTMGGDFQYHSAHHYFKNLDKLIKYVNEEQNNGSKVNVFYSTPSCYLYSLN